MYGTITRDHRAAGGATGSWVKVVCVGLIFLVAFLAVIIVIVVLLPASVAAPNE